MTQQTPKAFDFSEEAEPSPEPAPRPSGPRAFDFGDEQLEAAPVPASPPRALSFDDLPPAPEGLPAKAAARPLFDSEDHPAVRDALSIARQDYPLLFEQAEQRLAALFRRILPVNLALVADWGEKALMEQAVLLQPITDLVLKFTQMGVPALLDAALEATRAPTSVIGKLLRRGSPPAGYKPALTATRAQLVQLMADSEAAMREMTASGKNLALHAAVLAVVAKLAAGALDARVHDALIQRRTLIQQAIRQTELSTLQMEQVRLQAAELIGQISSFLTVTLPAIEMAQAQRGT
ncbi:hypothetical protein [Massilia sp. IC2-476]|uniref:hypothetical protein n=1 Tax=Massilia sp. IC2-476 TaxID=2887199 RepID=UPI001D12BE2E|nr:hypothetical protein [Massilia sp. IC2-476]MCC2974267.1 hypothetical protein [Massilia sp. IC2-476]